MQLSTNASTPASQPTDHNAPLFASRGALSFTLVTALFFIWGFK